MTKNFPKLITGTKSQIQESQRTPSKINTNNTLRHHIQISENQTGETFEQTLKKTPRKTTILLIEEQGK